MSRASASADLSLVELHGYVACPFAWRVRLVAAEKAVRADWIPCDVAHPDPRARTHNPDEHSPLLYHDGFVLQESVIIAQFLDDGFAGPALMPDDPRRRAELRLLALRLEQLDVHGERSRPLARRRSEPALGLFEEALGAQAFLHGEEPGLTDLLVWPFLADVGARGLLDADDFPAVAASLARAARRPSFRATCPDWAAVLG
jgi:glutathione S-transferase